MVAERFTIRNEAGIHIKPAEAFVSAIQGFDSEISIRYKEMTFNAKSIMILMAACIRYGEEIEVICEGADEKEALQAAADIIESGFQQ